MTPEPTQPRKKLRFDNLTIPADSSDPDVHDYYSTSPVWELTFHTINWWSADVQDQKNFEKLFPSKKIPKLFRLPHDVNTNEIERGMRIALMAGAVSFEVENLIFPLDRSYFAYRVSITDKKIIRPQNLTLTSSDDGGVEEGRKPLDRAEFQRRFRSPTQLKRHAEWAAAPEAFGEPHTRRASAEPSAVLGSDSHAGDQNPGISPGNVVELPEQLSPEEAAKQPLIYLFNVIVALEWEPDEADQEQLGWAFQRASDLLYDISDGTLAFGQVVIGTGVELAKIADIVIAASNRVLGRSWVGGLHHPSKRMPIRLGRGERRRDRVIPWNEPEGYRVILHEWAHYALHLRDAYLQYVCVDAVKEHDTTLVEKDLDPPNKDKKGLKLKCEREKEFQIGSADRYLVVPSSQLFGMTVMETLDGTSELCLNMHEKVHRMDSEREMLQMLYPSSLNKPDEVQGGPYAFDAQLPHIVFQQASNFKPAFFFKPQTWVEDFNYSFGHEREYKNSDAILFERCWIYIISPSGAPQRKLIAQGTFDIPSQVDDEATPGCGMRIIGAEQDDILVVIMTDDLGERFIGRYTAKQNPSDRNYEFCTLDNAKSGGIVRCGNLTSLVVVPELSEELKARIGASESLLTASGNAKASIEDSDPLSQQLPEIYVGVKYTDDHIQTEEVPNIWIYPLLGVPEKITSDDMMKIDGLDGHIVLWIDNDLPFIACFSHGGNPPNHITGQTIVRDAIGSEKTETIHLSGPSITAGSSNGTIRIYFDNRNSKDQDYRDMRFLTMVPSLVSGEPPLGARHIVSEPFTICSSKQIDQNDLHISLEVRYSHSAVADLTQGSVKICRLVGSRWEPIQTYQLPSANLGVATDICPGSAFYLPKSRVSKVGPFCEHYQLWWIPK